MRAHVAILCSIEFLPANRAAKPDPCLPPTTPSLTGMPGYKWPQAILPLQQRCRPSGPPAISVRSDSCQPRCQAASLLPPKLPRQRAHRLPSGHPAIPDRKRSRPSMPPAFRASGRIRHHRSNRRCMRQDLKGCRRNLVILSSSLSSPTLNIKLDAYYLE